MSEGITRSTDSATPTVTRQDGTIALEVDRALFSIDAVLRTAYKFTDRCHLFVQTHHTKADRLLVVIRPKNASDLHDDLLGDFSNELIDQRLRERLEQQFGDVRTLIVAQAFSEGNLLDQTPSDDRDYINDPRGIGRLRP